MNIILKYEEVERKIDISGVTYVAQIYQLQLTAQGIYSFTSQFPHKETFDLSYKKFSNGNGMLYIHTIRGVFSFHIVEDANDFIRAYKKHMKGL